MEIVFDRVTKLYGPVIGINDVSCRIGPGITGLIGANGAGKSTMLKLASGQLRPSQGSVSIGTDKAWSSRAKANIGYSPDVNAFYEDMTGREFVHAMARLYGYRASEARRRTADILERVGMADRSDRRIRGYSHGMRQRVKLAQGLIHDPPVLLLDEPFSGIDPGGRREFHEMLLRIAAAGKTVLVSSHILREVEQLAASVLVVSRGRLVASGSIREIRGLLEDQPLTVEITAAPSRRAAALLVAMPEVHAVEIDGQAIRVRTRSPAQFFARVGELVLEHRVQVDSLKTLDAGADAVFDYLARDSA
jgi:ABC-2 type transport system ATP-binding protein